MARLLQLVFGEIFYEIYNLCPNIAECYWVGVSVHFSCTNRVWHRHMVVPFTATNSDMHKVIFARSYIAKGITGFPCFLLHKLSCLMLTNVAIICNCQ